MASGYATLDNGLIFFFFPLHGFYSLYKEHNQNFIDLHAKAFIEQLSNEYL